MNSTEKSALKLLIIDPAIEVPEQEGVDIFLKFWPGEHEISRPAMSAVDAERLPEQTLRADAIVLLGSKASVHDNDDWLHTLRAALTPVLDGSHVRPLLAICFGHQFIAHAAGGVVGFLHHDQSKRIRIETSQFSGSRFIADAELSVVVSHQEIVSTAPPGYKITAQRPGVLIDALEHSTLPIFATQFHPEAREAFASRQGIPLSDINSQVKADGDRLIANFLTMARKFSSDRDNDRVPTGESL